MNISSAAAHKEGLSCVVCRSSVTLMRLKWEFSRAVGDSDFISLISDPAGYTRLQPGGALAS